jgi:hypothetical protein
LVDVEEGKDLAMVCVKDVGNKGIEEIGAFIKEKVSKMKKSSGGEEHKKRTKPFSFVPAFVVGFLIKIIAFITNALGISVKSINL